ncbi:MAG: glutathione peroxidase [Alphaproteobacteria bacterium]|nr:glutathione peroxidase [Alphaproteobacteria bacterium]
MPSLGALGVATLGVATLGVAGVLMSDPADAATSAFGFAFDALEGGPLPLAQFQGRALLVVNTASFCGYTSQYRALQALWERLEPRGLTVLGVPSNDFGAQEPGSNADIAAFCETTFGIDFPMTGKVSVRGANAHPFYRWAERELGPAAAPRWNFHKYLIDRTGRLAAWFPTQVAPDDARVLAAIERVLG